MSNAQQLSYDAQGRLSIWQNVPTAPAQTVNSLYDGSGNRVAMQSTVSGTTTLTSYIGSIEEVPTSGSTTQTTTYYAVGGKRVAADVNGTFYYFGYDALGSQVAVLNATGSLVGAQLYGPYGSSRYSTGTVPTSIGFTGQRGDSVTGLDYYNAWFVFKLHQLMDGNPVVLSGFSILMGLFILHVEVPRIRNQHLRRSAPLPRSLWCRGAIYNSGGKTHVLVRSMGHDYCPHGYKMARKNKWHGFINGIRTHPERKNKWRGFINGIFPVTIAQKYEDTPFIIPRHLLFCTRCVRMPLINPCHLFFRPIERTRTWVLPSLFISPLKPVGPRWTPAILSTQL